MSSPWYSCVYVDWSGQSDRSRIWNTFRTAAGTTEWESCWIHLHSWLWR